jgi:hypothetical protein
MPYPGMGIELPEETLPSIALIHQYDLFEAFELLRLQDFHGVVLSRTVENGAEPPCSAAPHFARRIVIRQRYCHVPDFERMPPESGEIFPLRRLIELLRCVCVEATHFAVIH